MAEQELRLVPEIEQHLRYDYGIRATGDTRINLTAVDKIAEKYPFTTERAYLDASGKVSKTEVGLLVERLNNGADGKTDNLITPTEIEHYAKTKFGPQY